MNKVDRETYLQAFKKQTLKPISSFSDPDGILSFGYGKPAMDTDWGTAGREEPIRKSKLMPF